MIHAPFAELAPIVPKACEDPITPHEENGILVPIVRDRIAELSGNIPPMAAACAAMGI